MNNEKALELLNKMRVMIFDVPVTEGKQAINIAIKALGESEQLKQTIQNMAEFMRNSKYPITPCYDENTCKLHKIGYKSNEETLKICKKCIINHFKGET